jgi:hypothetical protein
MGFDPTPKPSAEPPRIGRRGASGYWALSLYPDANEAGGCYVSLRPRQGGPGGRPDPDRAASEAARRARGKIRRYCAANRLNRLGTLTYAGAGCHDPAAVRHDIAAFFKGLRRALDGRALAYVWVPQWHPGGHGLHVHFAVGRFIARSLIAEAWPHGFTHIKLLGDLPVGSGTIEEARAGARYLARYVAQWDDGERSAGLHRYEVGQGFQPGRVVVEGRTAEEVLSLASEWFGFAPASLWRSGSEKDWHGPPAVWAAWAG